jgi:hypothetical protein
LPLAETAATNTLLSVPLLAVPTSVWWRGACHVWLRQMLLLLLL